VNQRRTLIDRLLGRLLVHRRRHLSRGVLPESRELLRLAQVSGRVDECSEGQRRYHIAAEFGMEEQWRTLIWPKLQGMDFRVVVDLAAGYGRNSAKLLEHAGELIIVDINQECIEHCQRRFAGEKRVRCLRTDGASLKGIADASVTLMYSFDAMVHFDSDVVRAYLREFERVLRPGGGCFCHHSNYVGQPGAGVAGTTHSRNFMSAELFAHYSIKSGLGVREQEILDWGGYAGLDCISILEKPLVSAGEA
jgi:ubiquinone/menaquinone biosynthesis C-methylase UbiE